MIARYEIRFEPHAVKELAALDPVVRKLVKEKLDTLACSSKDLAANIKKLKSKRYRDLYRLRIGHYRVIYRKMDRTLVILIVRIGHRREVYR